MKVVKDGRGEPRDSITDYWYYDSLGDKSIDEVFFYGYGTIENNVVKNYDTYKRRVFLQGEQPCGLSNGKQYYEIHRDAMDGFTEIYSSCPYTSVWLDELKGTNKYKQVPYFFSERHAVKNMPDKIYDVITWGGQYHGDHIDMLEVMGRYKHRFYTQNYQSIAAHQKHLITAVDIPRRQMWENLRASKVMLTSNILYLSPDEMANIKDTPELHNNEAFSRPDLMIAPQLKTRPIEAVFHKTLCLLKDNPWRVHAKWFTPGEDFLYYDTRQDMEEKLIDIIDNWDRYIPMVERAYKKAIRLYTSEGFFARLVGNK